MVLWPIRRRAPAPSEPPQCNDSPRDSESDFELRLSQERVKYTMLGGSEVVVGTSIAPYDLMHASRCCGDPPPRPRTRRTTTLAEPPHLSMTLHATSQSDHELRLSQERVKYAILGGSEVVVGTSIAPAT